MDGAHGMGCYDWLGSEGYLDMLPGATPAALGGEADRLSSPLGAPIRKSRRRRRRRRTCGTEGEQTDGRSFGSSVLRSSTDIEVLPSDGAGEMCCYDWLGSDAYLGLTPPLGLPIRKSRRRRRRVKACGTEREPTDGRGRQPSMDRTATVKEKAGKEDSM